MTNQEKEVAVNIIERLTRHEDVKKEEFDQLPTNKDYIDEVIPFLPNEARRWLRREGFIDRVDIVDLNEYKDGSSIDASTIVVSKSGEQIHQVFAIQLEKLDGIRLYAQDLFSSSVRDYENLKSEFINTLARFIAESSECCSILRLLVEITASKQRF